MDLKNYLKKAQKEKWAIGQFNFSTIEQIRGILEAGQKTKSPVILGTSEGESKFLGLKEIIALNELSKLRYKVAAFLNLDHAKNLNWIKKAIDLGYSSVHFDGSKLPYNKNIEETKKVVNYAHKKGVLVEAELGYVGGESKPHSKKATIKKQDLTLPDLTADFIRKTKVDSLAIAIGNIHGIYKGKPKLDFKRLKEIKEQTNVFLVLHGGSGILDSDIRKALKLGIVKVNINTELRLAWRNSLKKQLTSREIKPYKILDIVQDSVRKKTEEKIRLFKSINKM